MPREITQTTNSSMENDGIMTQLKYALHHAEEIKTLFDYFTMIKT